MKQWLLLISVVFVVTFNPTQSAGPCEWVESINSDSVSLIDCTVNGNGMYIWEDCAQDSVLLTAKDASFLQVSGCEILTQSDRDVKLARLLDAEVDNSRGLICEFTTDGLITAFYVNNVNDFNPEPLNGNRVTEASVQENQKNDSFAVFDYIDQDYRETESLTAELITEEFGHFSLTQESVAEKVTFKVGTEELDYETRMFYKLEFNIISTDLRGTTKNSTHTVLLSVVDIGDNPPSWVQTVYSQNFPEGETGRSVFTVSAVDRDININNAIQYSITKGNEDGYFEIDPTSGEVTNIKEIDREELDKNGNTFFSLEVTAQEITDEGPAPAPSSSTTTTNVYITDINNKIPEFSAPSYELEIPELTGQNMNLDIEIFVFDMDEGKNGQFLISSDHAEDLEILPNDARLNATLSLTALWREDTIFDFESTQDPIVIKIVATEKEDNSHTSSATITISLTDQNDNAPIFTQVEYTADVDETQSQGFVVMTVKANDRDISEEYGKESIRYYLPSCPALSIDEISGEVTLAKDDSLNFENTQTVTCSVEARDNNNTMPSLVGYSTIIINVVDVVDSPPELQGMPSDLEILENSSPGTALPKSITARDDDNDANIVFVINWKNSLATNQSLTVPVDLVREWFVIETVIVKKGEYSAVVKVGETSPDREVADLVSLAIEVIDDNTQVNADRDTGLLPVVIVDANDVSPHFVGSYDKLEVKENVQEGTLITTLEIFDPDVGDTFTFSISDTSLVEVIQSESNSKTADLRVVAGANIDREEMDKISVTVTVKDAVDQEASLDVDILITDLNDNPPVMDEGVCGKQYNISEVSGLEVYGREVTQNGTHVWDFIASDLDIGVEHKTITYILINEQQPGIKDRRLPFKINKETGELTVFLDPSQNKMLDREEPQGDFWELYVKAYDNCATDEMECEPKSSELCSLYINVMDVNDNEPMDFKWSSYPDNIIVNEFLKEGETAKDSGTSLEYEITASDLDEIGTDNTILTFTVVSVNKVGDSENLGLFKAVDRNRQLGGGEIQYYCILEATEDFTEQKGEYEIHIKAEDFGDPRLSGTGVIPLTIEDANDNTPEYKYYGCLDPDRTITMAENYYQSGSVILCTTPVEGEPQPDSLKIQVVDDDEGLNKQVEVSIDYQNTTVEPASVGDGQKSNFSIRPKLGSSDSYEIVVASSIDKEQGSLYNLSLYVRDLGEPPLESWSWIQVIVTNVFETRPYFCLNEEYCTQTIHILENDTDATTVFKVATDDDNIGVDPSDISNYDPVYYDIVGGNKGLFRLSSSLNTTLELTQALDRESVDSYVLYIDTFNEGQGGYPIANPVPRNYTLYVTVVVDDVNDNAPEFPRSVTLGSFTENDQKGNPVAFVMATDKDLEETLTYSLEDDFEWVDGGPISLPNTPFTIQQGENNTATVLLNFDPTGVNSGYCTFTIICKDNDKMHIGTTQAKIYAITVDYLLPVYFANTEQEVQGRKNNIEDIFGDVYGYPCTVDSISGSDSATDSKSSKSVLTRATGDTTVTVRMHFIDEENDEPVPTGVILEATNAGWVVQQLYDRLSAFDLNLMSIGDQNVDLGNDSAGQVLMLQILLAVVSFVLLSLVVLLMIAYCVRTRKLERQVKVLSTNTFGSHSSELNRIGTEMEAVPGSNKFLGEGSNPLYNLPDDDMRNDDGDSVSSGDSVLVGVEENPEFRSFGGSQNDFRGIDNGAFSRSIDQVSAPAGFSGGMRTNPLLEMGQGNGDDLDLTDALQNYNMLIRHGSSGSEEGHSNTYYDDNAFSF